MTEVIILNGTVNGILKISVIMIYVNKGIIFNKLFIWMILTKYKTTSNW